VRGGGIRGVQFAIINMPLVRTPMVAPTKIYAHFKLLEPEQAAASNCAAVVTRPACLSSPLGKLAQFVELSAPGLSRVIMNQAFQWFSEVERPHEEGAPGDRQLTAFAALAQGVH
jgi:hypothetical protein